MTSKEPNRKNRIVDIKRSREFFENSFVRDRQLSWKRDEGEKKA